MDAQDFRSLQEAPTARQQRLRQLQAAQRERNQAKGVSENYDLYDIVMDYLLDEGYAETPEAAEVIMVNMSEEWREDIVEARIDDGLSDDQKRTQRNARLGYRGSKDQDIGNMTRARNTRMGRGKKKFPAGSDREKILRGVGGNKYLNMQNQKSGKAKSDVASYHGN